MKRTLTCLLMCCWWAWAGAQTTFLTEDFSTGTGTTPPSGWAQNQLYTFSTATAANDFWHFDNPGGRSPAGNFSGNFTIFDSDNYSIDGFYENIALESPAFSTQGHDSVYLVLDYQLIAGGTAEGNVEVYNGDAWIIAKQYPNLTSNANRDTINISPYGRNNCSTRIRFRWSSNSGGAWMIDNVKVFSYSNGKSQNVSIKAIEAPLEGSCGNAATTVKIRVKNDGLATAINFPVTFSIYDGANTQTVTQIVTTGIGTCKDSLIAISTPVDMSYDSNFRIVAYTALPGDEQVLYGDTMRIASLHINQPPIFPSPLNQLVCGIAPFKDSVELGTGDNAFWYNQMADETPILTGKYYNIDPLNADTTYYVETYRSKRDRYPIPNLNPNIGFITPPTSAGIYVDIIAKADIVLDSMEISSVALGTFTYQVNVRKGTYLPYITNTFGWTQVLNTTVTAASSPFKVWVGSLKVNAGDTLGLYIYNSSNNGILFTSGPVIKENDAIKYLSNNVNAAGIFGGTQLPNYGYGGTFFFTRPCYSPRVARTLEVKPRPKGSVVLKATPFEGTFNAGIRTQPDVVAAGDELNYEITPPTGYNNSDYDVTWKISGISVMTVNGTAVPSGDYSAVMPGASSNGKFRFMPSSPFTDSLIWVRVIVMDKGTGNCDSILNRYIIVAPKGDPGFQIPASICAGQETEFMNTSRVSSGGLMSKWYFGDGDSSFDVSPFHIFNTPGTYNVRLVVTTNPYGYVTDTVASITVKAVPTVDFKTLNACDGDSVGFINKTTSTSGTPTYIWDFGDTETATGENAAHMYTQVGSYEVTLTASLNGCDISKTKQAMQYPNPVSDFTANVACVLEEVEFSNMSSIVDNSQLGYYWDFGNGAFATAENPSHNFGPSASFTVKLITSSEFGCKDTMEQSFNAELTPKADFSTDLICSIDPALFTNLTEEPVGVTVAYTWYFGDGDSSQVKDAQHIYSSMGSKMVTLRAVGSNGCSNVVDKEITVNVQPEANFTVTDGCSGDELYFVNSSSTSNNTVMTYSWTFDDGNSSTDPSPLHAYDITTNTTFDATLIAEGMGGCRDTIVKAVKVGYVPNCNFTVTNKGSRTYSFEPAQTTDLTYNWSFGDGGTSTQQSPEYQYPVYSNYPVTLTATTVSGNCVCEMQRLLSVNLGIESQSAVSFISLYPNPSNGKLAIQIDGNYASDVEMQVYNVLGEKVKSLDTRQFKGGLFETDLSDLANGVYLLQVNAPGKIVQTLRFTINK